MKKYKGKYYGPHKIVKSETAKDKTYLGKEKVKLIFEDESGITLPAEMAESIVMNEAVDLNVLREMTINPIVQKIVVILTEAELKKEDLQHVVEFILPETIKLAKRNADKKLWGKEDYEITLADIDKVLKQ
jgi:hypothetical protein